MSYIAQAVILLVAGIHFLILYKQMVTWQTPDGLKQFNLTPEVSKSFKLLAFQQGLYNGFLAIGLVMSIFVSNIQYAQYTATFFLLCVLSAGLLGGFTVKKQIFLIQALPAASGLLFLWLK